MLEAIELPASISDLNASLANVDGNALSHFLRDENGRKKNKKEKNEEVSVYEDATPPSLWQNDPFFWFGFLSFIGVDVWNFIKHWTETEWLSGGLNFNHS